MFNHYFKSLNLTIKFNYDFKSLSLVITLITKFNH
jgi:hypothetical protein